MYSLMKVIVWLSISFATANAAAVIQRDTDFDLFGSTGAPALADFGAKITRSEFGPVIYAMKQAETKGWMNQQIHRAIVSGHNAAYFDIYGEDGEYKSYPVMGSESPWWIAGYNDALDEALNGKDQVKTDSLKENPANVLKVFTGKETEGMTKVKDADELISICKTFKESAVIIRMWQQDGTGGKVKRYFAVTNVNEETKKIELWSNSGRDANQKFESDAKVILGFLVDVGKLKEGEKLEGNSASPKSWKDHIAKVDLI